MATGTADVAIMISGELAKLEEAASSADQGEASGSVYPGVVGIDPSARMLEVSFVVLALEVTSIAPPPRYVRSTYCAI